MRIALMITAGAILFLVSTSMISLDKDIYVDVNYRYPDSDGSVYKPYRSIQQAIDRAEDGDNIYIFSGYYNETLIIDKSVRIQAIEPLGVNLSKNEPHLYTIKVLADRVAIEGIRLICGGYCYTSGIYIKGNTTTIQGNEIIINGTSYAIYIDKSYGNTIGDNRIEGGKGIYIREAKDNAFVGNEIRNATGYGIEAINSQNLIVYDNLFYGNRYGIYAYNTHGINITKNEIDDSKVCGVEIVGGGDATISDNEISGNPTGIDISSDGREIRNNTFSGNSIGIYLKGRNMEIYDNLIEDSTACGLSADSSSLNNIIYGNIFRRNAVNAQDDGNNQWDNGVIGNYWDDYNDVDRDGDGIGDYPYRIGKSLDRYPTGKFLEPPDKPTLVSPKDGEDNVGLKPELSVKVTDPDSDYLSVYFYYEIEGLGEKLAGVRHGIPNGGVAKITLRLPYDANVAWYVVVNDSKLETTSDIWTFYTLPVPPANKRPVADPGGPYQGVVNEPVKFDGSGSYDPDGSIVFYRWNFGDGSGEILEMSPTHIYGEVGTYTVTLTVIDNNGTSDTKTTTVTIEPAGQVENQKPIPVINIPDTGKVNKLIKFDGSQSHDPDGEITNYTWEFGDGSVGYGAVVYHAYSKPGMYEVRLTVKDDDGAERTASTYIKIEKEKKSPGFEILITILSIVILIFILRRR